MKGTVNGVISQADEGVNPGKQFFLTGLMEGNELSVSAKLAKGRMSVVFGQKINISCELGLCCVVH